jgi:transcription elongation factor/antiterminator RfaH
MPDVSLGGRDLGDVRWCVVHSQPHRELRAAANLNAQGFRAFVPLHRKTIRHARQFRSVFAPLFPRYLFVHLGSANGRWTSIRGTYGVSHLIMDGDQPRSVPVGVVEELLDESDDRGVVNLESILTPGDTVRITTGAFAGLVGTLASLDSSGRVKVLLDILGKDVVARGKLGLVPAA